MTLAERPIKRRQTTPAFHLTALLTAMAVVAGSIPTRAQSEASSRSLPIIRDAEIEQLLRDYSQPILRAAGLGQQNIRVVIINERSFNAFVADGRRIFVNSGALLDSETSNQIIGVLAHETGHISGGHLAKMREQLANASTQSIIATVLGVGAMVAAAHSGSDSGRNVGMAAILAPQEMIRRSLLSYMRAHEEQADRAGVKYLTATRQSPKGMYDTFKRFADQMMFTARFTDPYVQSHPMPSERVAALGELAQASPYWAKKDPPELQMRHDLMRAKLSGFMERPDTIARRYPPSDTSLAARYARAISAYRNSDLRNATAQIDSLIHAQPGNPYFYELKGQALLESGKPAEAIASLRHAVQLAPNPALIQVMLGKAMIATNNPKLAEEAVGLLRAALAREPEVPEGFTQLAMAYGRKGDLAQADLASAQAAAARGDMRTARDLAARAKKRFAVGTPGWVKSDDILASKPSAGSKTQ
jgi:predicted Zn-dependent protease